MDSVYRHAIADDPVDWDTFLSLAKKISGIDEICQVIIGTYIRRLACLDRHDSDEFKNFFNGLIADPEWNDRLEYMQFKKGDR